MVDTWFIDYSATQLDGHTIVQAKVGPNGEYATGAIRYIDDITNSNLVRPKHITKDEYASLRAAGVVMDAMYMEVGVDDPLGGYGQGQAFARRAQTGATYLGWTGKILFCCDRWLNAAGRTPIPVQTWQDYLDGAVSVLGRSVVGGYGFADAIDAARGHVDFAVQCGARSAVRSWVNGWQDNNFQPTVGGIQADRVLILNSFSNQDWIDMATQDEVKQAVKDGVLEALQEWNYYRYPDGRNLVDDKKQQTGSLLGIQGQLDELPVLADKLDAVTAAINSLKPPAPASSGGQ